MGSDCGDVIQRRRGKIDWHGLHFGQIGKKLNQNLESDQKPDSTKFHDFGTVFQHLGAHWVENEQSRGFHFACPAKAVNRFQPLGINVESVNSVLSPAFCQTPGNPEESSNITGKKLRT